MGQMYCCWNSVIIGRMPISFTMTPCSTDSKEL